MLVGAKRAKRESLCQPSRVLERIGYQGALGIFKRPYGPLLDRRLNEGVELSYACVKRVGTKRREGDETTHLRGDFD